MAKKLDLGKLKDFFFQYGEKVALGVCGALAVTLLALGFLRASGAGNHPTGKRWDEALTSGARSVESKVASASLNEDEIKGKYEVKKDDFIWTQRELSFQPGPYSSLAEQADTKRRNPFILPLKSGEKDFQMDVLKGPYFNYVIDPQKRNVMLFKADGAAGGGAGIGGGVGPVGGMMGGGMMGGQGGGTPFVKGAEPKRAVVVTGVFPMKNQVELHRKALRMESQTQLFANRDDLPKPLGINVYRYEVLRDGTFGPPVKVYFHDADKGKLEILPALDRVMRDAHFDETFPAQYEQHVFAGITTPIPQFANLTMPKLTLEGITGAEVVAAADPANPMGGVGLGPLPKGGGGVNLPGGGRPPLPGGGNPMNPEPGAGGAAGGQGRLMYAELWKKIQANNKLLVEKFDGKYNVFHVLGEVPGKPAEEKKGGVGSQGPIPGMPNMGGAQGAALAGRFFAPWDRIAGAGGGAGMPNMPGKPGTGGAREGEGPPPPPAVGDGPAGAVGAAALGIPWEHDAIVRFLDVDLLPGKTYRYQVQVRMANPNFGKKSDVAFQALADVKEILSPWTPTPEVKIPDEYHFYNVDQFALDKAAEKIALKDQAPKDTIAMQIHRWFIVADDRQGVGFNRNDIGDWGILERAFIRRGDFIGQNNVVVEVPVWDRQSGSFQIDTKLVKEKGKSVQKPGVPLDFIVSDPPPLLVDFDGGKRSFKVGNSTLNDDSAVEALVMTPEGRLIVRNSRLDSDPVVPEAKQRQDRLDAARQRVQQVRQGAAAAPAGGGPAMPGMPGRN